MPAFAEPLTELSYFLVAALNSIHLEYVAKLNRQKQEEEQKIFKKFEEVNKPAPQGPPRVESALTKVHVRGLS